MPARCVTVESGPSREGVLLLPRRTPSIVDSTNGTRTPERRRTRPVRAVARPWLACVLAGALPIALLSASPVRPQQVDHAGAAHVVAAPGDGPDAAPGDGVCASVGGPCTLRAAIQEANAAPGADSIELPAGVYELAVPPLNDNGIETGDLDITDDLTIAGAGATGTTVDAGAPPPGSPPNVRGLDRLFEVHATAGAVEFSRLTIRDGSVDDHGAGILNAGPAEVVVRESAIEGNVAGTTGGGIDNHADGSVRVIGSRLTGNSAGAGSALNNNAGGTLVVAGSAVSGNGDPADLQGGSAIENHGELGGVGTVEVTDSTISDNVALGGSGGGIDNNGSGSVTVRRTTVAGNTSGAGGGGINNASGTVTVDESTVTRNSAGHAGGIGNYGGTTPEGDPGSVSVDRTTISENTATAAGGGVGNGGEGHLAITRSTISGNTAEGEGGGIATHDKARLSLSAATVTGNRAASGGGFDNGGDGPVTVVNSDFLRNTATGGGGAVRNDSDGELALSGNRLADNEALEGGGFANDGDGTARIGATRVYGNRAHEDGGGVIVGSGTVEIQDAEVTGNGAGGAGGGISYHGDGVLAVGETATLIDSTVSDNRAAGSGGGIDSRGDGTFAIRRSIVSANTGQTGGGVTHAGDATLSIVRSAVAANAAAAGGGLVLLGEAIVENTTVSGNRAEGFGGGLLAGGRATLAHVTFAGNAAAVGGAISNGDAELVAPGLVFLRNTIVANSPAGGNCAGILTSEGGNLDSEDSCGLQPDIDIVAADPRLGPLRDNGGETLTHALDPGSPALDSAMVGHCPGADQRGVPRPQGAGCDIGAHEHSTSAVCPTVPTQALAAEADAWLDEGSPQSNFGADEILQVKSQSGNDQRTLVRFDLPDIPAGCRIESARLRLRAANATDGRVLEAMRITDAWAEPEVSWDDQPGSAGPAATTVAAGGTGEWLVTAQVEAMYAHGNHGFLLRDASEDGVGTEQAEQSYHSREKVADEPPELVLNLASTAVSDTTPPGTSILAGPVGFSNDPTPTFSFTANEDSDFECSLDGGDFTGCSSPHTVRALNDGDHTFAVRAVDLAGNPDPSPATSSFSVDTAAPDTTITAGPAGTTGDAVASFSFVATEVGSFECRIDDGPFAACESPHSTPPLAAGAHTFEVRAVDRAGNRDGTPASRSLVIEAAAEAPPGPPPAPGTSPEPSPAPGTSPGVSPPPGMSPGPSPPPGGSQPAGGGPQPAATQGAGQMGRPGSGSRRMLRVRLRGRRLRVRRGVATLKLTCPSSQPVCAGRIVLRVRRGARAAGARRPWVLGSARYRIPGGRTAKVRVRLAPRRWAQARRRPALRVEAVITMRGSASGTVALRVR
jgi:hypothetical protein